MMIMFNINTMTTMIMFKVIQGVLKDLQQAVLVSLLLPHLLDDETVVRLLFKKSGVSKHTHNAMWWCFVGNDEKNSALYHASWQRLEEKTKETIQGTDGT